MLRIVVDTNVFVSGLISPVGAPAAVLDGWRDRLFVLCVSPDIIAEIRDVLNRPRIRTKYGITASEIDQVLLLLQQGVLAVPGTSDVAGAIGHDPTDEKFLSCALDAEADLIVTGDRHLLSLESYAGIQIVTPRAFLDVWLHRSDPGAP